MNDSSPKPRAPRLPVGWFLLIAAAYLVDGSVFILHTSFVIDGTRYFALFDDAMISMRYAANFADGHGLVWNPGEPRVEGYTNLLWVLYMAIFHLLPIAKEKVSLCIQVTSLLALTANLYLLMKLAFRVSNGSRLATVVAMAFTAFYLPLNNWSLQGMEVGVLTLLVTWAALRSLEVVEEGRSPLSLFAALGVATFIRLDAVVPFLGVLAFLFLFRAKNRFRIAFTGMLFLAGFLAIQTLFRWMYYGDLLPNTYYLKMVGFPMVYRVLRGAAVLLEAAWRMNWAVWLVALSVFLYRRDRRVLLPAGLFGLQVMHSVYVGGDAWERWGGANRFISVAVPMFFLLFGCGVAEGWVVLRGAAMAKGVLARAMAGLLLTGVLGFSMISVNSIYGPTTVRDWGVTEWLLLRPPLHVEDNKLLVERAQLIQRITEPEATVAVTSAGNLPYFLPRPCVDLLGKNDRHIAHEPMRVRQGSNPILGFYPGHMKWDTAYSIGELRPDVLASWYGDKDDVRALLDAHYRRVVLEGQTLYLLKGSPRVLWDEVNARDGSA